MTKSNTQLRLPLGNSSSGLIALHGSEPVSTHCGVLLVAQLVTLPLCGCSRPTIQSWEWGLSWLHLVIIPCLSLIVDIIEQNFN